MTTGRMLAALGAVALGIATVTPTLAQNTTGGTTPPSASTGTTPAAPATSNAPSGSPAAAATAPMTNPAATAGTATAGTHHGSSTAAMHTHAHPMHRVATRTTHHPMRTGISEANPNAQNDAVDQLNQQSLQAAQQGKTFSPTGRM